MLRNDYQYALVVSKENGDPLAQVPVTVDWEPAREWVSLRALRRGLSDSMPAGGRVCPLWHRTAGEPFIDGFRVSVSSDSGEVATDFANAYFKGLALEASAGLVEKGQLESGERFRFLVTAFPRQDSVPAAAIRFTAEEAPAPIVFKDTPLSAFLDESTAEGPGHAEDMEIFLPQLVLDEAVALTHEAEARETGGILIGHLHRDRSRPDVFGEVTAQVHARNADADLTRLTFTAETWTDVRTAIELRRKAEVMLGWWHSHPVKEWCKECAADKQQSCGMASSFFSAHDKALHRAVFPRAYSIGLVVNDRALGGVSFSLFGWRQGSLEPRGFNVIRAVRSGDGEADAA